MKKLFVFVTTLICLAACSNEQIYNSLSGAKENECQKIVDANERARCLDAAKESYEIPTTPRRVAEKLIPQKATLIR